MRTMHVPDVWVVHVTRLFVTEAPRHVRMWTKKWLVWFKNKHTILFFATCKINRLFFFYLQCMLLQCLVTGRIFRFFQKTRTYWLNLILMSVLRLSVVCLLFTFVYCQGCTTVVGTACNNCAAGFWGGPFEGCNFESNTCCQKPCSVSIVLFFLVLFVFVLFNISFFLRRLAARATV